MFFCHIHVLLELLTAFQVDKYANAFPVTSPRQSLAIANLSYLQQNDDLLNTAKSLLEHREEVANRLSGGGDTGMSDTIRALNRDGPPSKNESLNAL